MSLDPEFQADLSYRTFAPSRHLVPVKHCTMTGRRHIVPGASLGLPSADFWPRWPTWGQYQAIAAVLASFVTLSLPGRPGDGPDRLARPPEVPFLVLRPDEKMAPQKNVFNY